MFKSYYFLNRTVIELNEKISGSRITGIFSQEKDKLIIQFDDPDDIVIEISVNHSEPYITLRRRFQRAKRNTVDIFQELINQIVLSFSIAIDDRIIKVDFEDYSFFFAIRGKYTNAFLMNDSSFISFKDEDTATLKQISSEFQDKKFIREFNYINLELLQGASIKTIRENFKFIGKELAQEVISRTNDESLHSQILIELLNEVKSSHTVIYNDLQNNEIKIGFDSFKIFSDYQKEYSGDFFKTLNEFLIKKNVLTNRVKSLNKISDFLEKDLQRTINKIEKLESVINSGPQDELYKKYANLILINLNKIDAGANNLICDDNFEPGNEIRIPLDNKLSPQKNAEKYFDKAKSSLIEFRKAEELLIRSKKNFQKMIKIKEEVNSSLPAERIDQIMKELKIKDENQLNKQPDLSEKFKHYIISEKYHVFVGKDSQNNDLLTTKYAKQNDLWFHARSVSGSHVVLRVENTKEAIPKPVIKKTASLAAYHSKAKTAGIVPVSYTYKKYVVKRKGMPLGQVALLKEEVLLVKPEIPDGCDYIQS